MFFNLHVKLHDEMRSVEKRGGRKVLKKERGIVWEGQRESKEDKRLGEVHEKMRRGREGGRQENSNCRREVR